MHPNFAFSATQILWTLLFAAQLILLVVLMGRERLTRFPWFTAGVLLATLRLLCEVLLSGRVPILTLQGILISMADLTALVGIAVLVEIARRAFPAASRKSWLMGAPALALLAGVSLIYWGPWPKRADLAVDSPLALLRLMQFLGQKADLLVCLLTVGLALLVFVFRRRFAAGCRSHASLILIGLFSLSAVWLAITAYWQHLTHTIHPDMTREQYQQILALGNKLFMGNRILQIAVQLWWIACLWFDEPGETACAAVATGPELPALSATTAPEEE
jgi:hypothetical protein